MHDTLGSIFSEITLLYYDNVGKDDELHLFNNRLKHYTMINQYYTILFVDLASNLCRWKYILSDIKHLRVTRFLRVD